MSKRRKSNKKRGYSLKLLGAAALLILVLIAGYQIKNKSQVKEKRAVQSEQPVTVVAAGDIACDPGAVEYNRGKGTRTQCRMQATAQLAKDAQPDHVLVLGDLQYMDGTLDKFYKSYDKSWGVLKSITKPVPGNHEYENGPHANGYFDYFGKSAGERNRGYYSYDVGSWHIIALNSNCIYVGGCQVGSPQEQWLGADLAKHQNKCTLAYFHHPLFSSGVHGNNYGVLPLWQKLALTKADVVLTGHDHTYERFAPQDHRGKRSRSGTVQFIVGTGGKDLYPFAKIQNNSLIRHNTSSGVLKLILGKDRYSWEFISEKGNEQVDSGTALCV